LRETARFPSSLNGPATLFAIGPLCGGSLFEITAAPEITMQARDLAETVNSEIRRRPASAAPAPR
jgi:uncharacterized NAD(P)/FAD-binding protein YdhS